MAGTIWLIVEGQNDGDIVEAIVQCLYPKVRISPLRPPEKKPNLSHLAANIEKLIEQAMSNRKPGDCIVVLHDADEQTQPDRTIYKQIEAICQRNSQDVIHMIARDKLESWLLSDEGICTWLKIKPQSWDGKSDLQMN